MVINLDSIPGIQNGDWVVIAPSLGRNSELVVCKMDEWKEEVKGYLKNMNILSSEQLAHEEKMIKSAIYRQVNYDLCVRVRISNQVLFNKGNAVDVLAQVNIDEVVQDFVAMKKRGVHLLGLCPFHKEETPSFMVSTSKNIFKCFGCGKGGDAITFVMEIKNMSYLDSLKYLAKKYKINLTDDSDDWLKDSEIPF